MINKEQYNDSEAIAQDKQDFIDYAYFFIKDYDKVLSFMDNYENLKTFEENLNKLKEFIK